jgi:hypothetical protein
MSGGPTRVLVGHCPAKRLGIDVLIFLFFRFGWGSAGSKNMEFWGIRFHTALGLARKALTGHIILSDDWVHLCMGSCLAEAIMGGM